MRIFDRLGGSPGAAHGRTEVQRSGGPRSFGSRLQRSGSPRAVSWRQLLRLNRQAQVDPLLEPPVPPPGFSATDPGSERNLIRRLVDNPIEPTRGEDPAAGLEGRQEAIDRMLKLLGQQQRAHDELSARAIRTAAKWQ